MKGSFLWIAISAFLASCDSPDLAEEADSSAPSASKQSVRENSHGRVKVVFSDEPDKLVETVEKRPSIAYAPGDTFQGMWNYDKRNFSLRLDIVSVDPEERTIVATLKSSDLDDVEKEFRGTIGEGGRQLFLQGVAGSGSDYEPVSGYDVRDLLRKSSVQKLNLTDCNARKLRGSTEDGTNVYFWSKVER